MISVTSATPASAGKAQNTTQALALRALDRDAPPVFTFHGYCVKPFTWKRRECLGGRGKNSDARGWEDICIKPGTSEYDSKQSSCDPNNYCLDTYSYERQEYYVICTPLQKSRGKQLISEQTGSSEPKSSPGGGRTGVHFAVTIDHDVTDAAVSAILKGECHTVNVQLISELNGI